jgi:ribosomal protein S18 acetylase RimI-like enzyme
VKTEFRKAGADEIRSLMIFDRKAFREYPDDWFDREYWSVCESWWMIVDGKKVGCCAFEHGARGWLYITTTGILPEFRGVGLGSLLKGWQLAYARQRGFKRIITNTRKSNVAMIGLNRKFGFKIVQTKANYYRDPVEATVVMELRLR